MLLKLYISTETLLMPISLEISKEGQFKYEWNMEFKDKHYAEISKASQALWRAATRRATPPHSASDRERTRFSRWTGFCSLAKAICYKQKTWFTYGNRYVWCSPTIHNKWLSFLPVLLMIKLKKRVAFAFVFRFASQYTFVLLFSLYCRFQLSED